MGVVSFATAPIEPSYATRNMAEAIEGLQYRMDHGLPTVFHNCQFDLHFLQRYGLRINWACIEDTLIMARLIDNLRQSNALKDLGESVLGIPATQKDELQTYLRKHKLGHNYIAVPDEILLPYAKQDTVLTWQLYHDFAPKVNQEIYRKEMRVRELMFNAETRGVQLDTDLVRGRLDWASAERQVIDSRLRSLYGDESYNPDSNPETSSWLYGRLGLNPVSFTPTGQPQVNEYNLASNPHPVTRLLVARNKRVKAQEFFQSYLDLMDEDGVLHPNINTVQARTHRMSCTSPNLQQIPARKDRFKTREVFTAGLGWAVGADYAKQELFIAACEAGETQLVAELIAGVDVYREMAAAMLSKSVALVTNDERTAAKVTVLSMIYGAGAPKVAESFTVNTGRPFTVEQARLIRANFKRRYPKLSRMMDELQAQVRAHGKVTNRWGRDLFVEPQRAYVATDYLVQSSGGDVMKDALIRVADDVLPRYGAELLWPIHDELLAWFPEEPTRAALLRVEAAMRCDKFDLPLTAVAHKGKRLSELK